MKTSSKILAVVVIVLIIGFLVYIYDSRISTPVENSLNNSQKSQASEQANNTKQDSNQYKDGSYTVSTQYMTPGGLENLGVTVSLVSDKISSVSIQNQAAHKTSKNYQNKFISGIASVSVGKSLSDASVSVVSGASLTSNSFNQALAQIRLQAKN